MATLVSDIITLFESYSDDTTELAQAGEIAVINKNLRKISSERTWNFLKVNTSGVTDSNSQIALPTDFNKIGSNYAADATIWRDDTAVIYVGVNKIPYPIIPMGLVEQAKLGIINGQFTNWYGYFNNIATQFAYIDYGNNKINVNASVDDTCYFSYHKNITNVALVTDTIPLPNDYADVLLYGLLIDDIMIQKIDALKALLPQNQQMYQEYLANLRVWDSGLFNF